MKWLVAGGRDFTDKKFLFQKLDRLADQYSKEFHPKFSWFPTDITIIAGGAKGADTLAVDWAVTNYAPFIEVKAEWDKHGKKAGWLRNNAMADLNPDLVILFAGGRGTQMMHDIAKNRGIEILDFRNG